MLRALHYHFWESAGLIWLTLTGDWDAYAWCMAKAMGAYD